MNADWMVTTIGECLDTTRRDPTAIVPTTEYQAIGKFPIVDQGAKPVAGWTDDEQVVITDALPLVVFGDHTRALKYIDYPFARGADGTQLLRTKPWVDTRFFYHACRAVDLPSRGYNRHLTMLREQEIRVPVSLREQQAIARVLRFVEGAAAVQAQIVGTVDELYRSVLSALFSRGSRGEQVKETEIGPMPASWEPRAISELCEIRSGGTPRKSVVEYWEGEIPWVSGKDLKRPVLDDAADHLSEEGVDTGSRVAPEDSVLLLVRGMGLAKDLPVATISRPMAFNQDVKALLLREDYGDYSGRFLRSSIYAGRARLLSQIVTSAHGTMTLNLNDVESFQIACPTDPVEATEIAFTVSSLEIKAALHRQKAALLGNLLESLTHKLMTREMSVDDLNLSALSDRSGVAA